VLLQTLLAVSEDVLIPPLTSLLLLYLNISWVPSLAGGSAVAGGSIVAGVPAVLGASTIDGVQNLLLLMFLQLSSYQLSCCVTVVPALANVQKIFILHLSFHSFIYCVSTPF
jgi:hypothetical protein